MVIEIVFGISGLMVLLLPLTKKLGERRRKPLFIFKLISKGDETLREIYHTVLHTYSEWKDKVTLLFNKKLYMYSRNILNKMSAFVEEKKTEYLNNMRDSKLLKRSDGISEFYKSMSSVEKGNGEIYEDFESSVQKDEERVI